MKDLTDDDLARRIEELGPWFHNLHLGPHQTAPDHFLGDFPRTKFERFAHAIPEDLSGKSVLDIGCNAGFYSLEMKRRGAARVLGVDVWRNPVEAQRRHPCAATGGGASMAAIDQGALQWGSTPPLPGSSAG